MYKYLAAAIMLIDHIFYIFSLDSFTFNQYLTGRSFGRLAFPMFAYALARGYNRTSNKYKYFLRLSVFAILTQILFNQVTYGLNYQQFHFYNVLITFSLAFLILLGMDFIENASLDMMINLRPLTSEGEVTKRFSPGGIKLPSFMGKIIGLLLIAAAIIVCALIQPDYDYYGLMTVVIFQRLDRTLTPYEKTMRKDLKISRWSLYFLSFGVFNLIFALLKILSNGNNFYSWIQMFSLTSIFLFPIYEHQAKPKNIEKYFFYIFYPLHFVILLLIKYHMK